MFGPLQHHLTIGLAVSSGQSQAGGRNSLSFQPGVVERELYGEIQILCGQYRAHSALIGWAGVALTQQGPIGIRRAEPRDGFGSTTINTKNQSGGCGHHLFVVQRTERRTAMNTIWCDG